MKKSFALPLIVSLGLTLLLLAIPPVLAATTDSLASSIAPSPDIESYHPPQAFQISWYADAGRLEVDVYPDGEWRLAPDCYSWPASCWDIAGDRWSFRLAEDESGQWALISNSGDYTPGDHGMEQALVDATLTILSTGDPTTFAVFDPAFDGCYIRLLLALREQELPASGVWPTAGPWSRCPW